MKASAGIRICLGLFLVVPITLMAQKQYSEEVTVVAPYQPKISDANKINFNPEIKDTIIPKPNFKYSIQSTIYPTTYTPEPISPAKMAGEPVKKLYENLLKIGFGSYITPYGEYIFNSTRSKELAYGAQFKHISGSGKIKDYAFPGYSENSLKVFGRQFKEKQYNVSADAGFKRDGFHFYGFNPDDFNPAPAKEDFRQHIANIFLNAGISSARDDSSLLAYTARLGGYYLFDHYKTTETNIKLEGGIEQTRKLLKISKDQRWGIKTKLEYFNNKSENIKSGGNLSFEIRPFLYAKRGALELKAGFNTTIESDSSTYLHFYPEIELKARVIPDWLSLFFGVTGSTERNSYKKFTDENPYVSPGIPLTFMNTKYKFYGGFNSNIANIFDLYLVLSRSLVENQYFYVNTENDSLHNQFTVFYDDNCEVFNLKTELAWHYSKRFSLMYRFHLHQYYTSEYTAKYLPWQVSDFDMSLMADYNIQDKLKFEMTFIYFDRMYALEYNPNGTSPEPKYLRDRIDLNLGIEYRYNKMISAFLHLNNLTSVRYYYWNNYPSYKFNILGGLSFSF